jgi:hypothetical protein
VYESTITSREPRLSEVDVTIETGIFKRLQIKVMERNYNGLTAGSFFCVEVLPMAFKVDLTPHTSTHSSLIGENTLCTADMQKLLNHVRAG